MRPGCDHAVHVDLENRHFIVEYNADNERGYVAGNVLVISYLANRCKGNLNADDIIKLGMNLKFLEAFRA